MNTWQLVKAIFHSVDFYWKKLIILSVLLIVAGIGAYIWYSHSKTTAAFQFSDLPQYSTVTEKNMNVEIQKNGKVLVDGKPWPNTFNILPDYDEIRLLALESPGVFIETFRATITLPKPVNQDQIQQITYAVHGVGSYRNYMQNSTTLVYEAKDISTQASLTLIAHLPKGMIQPPILSSLAYYISAIPAQSYLILALTLPIITLIVMFFMIYKRRKDQIISLNVKPINVLPTQVAPAVAGVLLDGQVTARELAATLIDLAYRGYIFITKTEHGFSFGKRKSLRLEEMSELRPFERILLAKIFTLGNFKSTKDDVEIRVGHHIFSRKIAQVFLEVYNEATKAGYFIQNPAAVHRRWRYIGVGLFFLSILGFIQSAIYAPDPKFTLLFWVGSLSASAVIIKTAGMMPVRSARGSRALKSWMAFRKYLKLNQPIEPGSNNQDLFNRYLSYAIVFGVEAEWARRFMREPFTPPAWYASNETINSLEDFVGGLYPLISFTSRILAKSHEPTVE